MLRAILVSFALIPALLFAGPKEDAAMTKSLVGIWQVSNLIAAGWNMCYRFFPDGKFIWHANQMDPYARLMEEEGIWYYSAGKLTLKITGELRTVGGKRLSEKEAVDGEYGYVGYKDKRTKFNPPKVRTFALSKINKGNPYSWITLGHTKFWKMRSDPKDYQ